MLAWDGEVSRIPSGDVEFFVVEREDFTREGVSVGEGEPLSVSIGEIAWNRKGDFADCAGIDFKRCVSERVGKSEAVRSHGEDVSDEVVSIFKLKRLCLSR